MKNYLVLLSIFIFCSINAQKSNEVLLYRIKNINTTPLQKIDYLCELSLQLQKKDSVLAFGYGYQALKISQQLGHKTKEVIVLESISKLYGWYADVPNQIKYADKCFTLASQINTPEAMAYGNYAIAYKYEIIGDKEKYISYMLKALSYFEKNKTRYDKLVNAYENLGAFFRDNNDNINLNRKCVKKALALGYESKNPINIANALTSWALYLDKNYARNENVDNPKILDSVENCYLKAIDLFEKKQSIYKLFVWQNMS